MLAVFLDQETTGLDPTKHNVLEIALRIYQVEADLEIASYETVVKLSVESWAHRNHTSVEINGFTFQESSAGKEIIKIREEIIALFNETKIIRGGAVFICQNPAFDKGFFSQIVDVEMQEQLHWPYHWLDLASMFWLIRIGEARQQQKPFPTEMDLSKDQIAKYFDIPPEQKPHRAMNGVDHLLACYHAVMATSAKTVWVNRPFV